MNVKAVGRKRFVSIESQAMLANNLPHPITLFFEIWQLNQHSQDLVDRKEENEFEDFENLRYGEANLNETKEMIDDMLIEEIDVDDLQNDIQRKLALKMK